MAAREHISGDLAALSDRLHHIECLAAVIGELFDCSDADALQGALAVTVREHIVQPLRAEIETLARLRAMLDN